MLVHKLASLLAFLLALYGALVRCALFLSFQVPDRVAFPVTFSQMFVLSERNFECQHTEKLNPLQ